MRHIAAAGLVTALAAGGGLAPASAQVCAARSGPRVVQVVELYTSEGCDSCPGADRWASGLKGRPGVLVAGFHVDYWDRLGWKDRFASPRFTQRQGQTQAHSGARFSYTPQVLVDGRDWRSWPALPEAEQRAPLVQLALQRMGETVQVRVSPQPGAPRKLGLWWAAVEDQHVSAVKAGENAGVTLRHDHVVRQYAAPAPVDGDQASSLTIQSPAAGEGGRPLRLIVVATDAANGKTVQAVELGC
jgi:hypothetical protein